MSARYLSDRGSTSSDRDAAHGKLNHYFGFCAALNIRMARPRGRQKTARVTVNLEDQVYGVLTSIAAKNDAPLAWVVHRAVLDLIEKEASRNERSLPPLKRLARGQDK